jgi:hypothetical protein
VQRRHSNCPCGQRWAWCCESGFAACARRWRPLLPPPPRAHCRHSNCPCGRRWASCCDIGCAASARRWRPLLRGEYRCEMLPGNSQLVVRPAARQEKVVGRTTARPVPGGGASYCAVVAKRFSTPLCDQSQAVGHALARPELDLILCCQGCSAAMNGLLCERWCASSGGPSIELLRPMTPHLAAAGALHGLATCVSAPRPRP